MRNIKTYNNNVPFYKGSFDTGYYCSNYENWKTKNLLKRIYLGGRFTTYNGISANRIVCLNYDGSINNEFNYETGFDNEVHCINIDNNNRLYVGGEFTTYNGLSVNKLIRLLPNGDLDTSFNCTYTFNYSYHIYNIQYILIEDERILVLHGTNYSLNGLTIFDFNGNLISDVGFGNSIMNVIKYDYNPQNNNWLSKYKYLATVQGNPIPSRDFYSFGNLSVTRVKDKIYNGGYGYPSLTRYNYDLTIDDTFIVDSKVTSTILYELLGYGDKIILCPHIGLDGNHGANRLIMLNWDGSIDNTWGIRNIETGNDQYNKLILDSTNKIWFYGLELRKYDNINIPRMCRINGDGSIDDTFNNGGVGVNDSIMTMKITY